MAELELTPIDGGTRLRLRVRAGGRRNAIVGIHGGALKLCVTPPPERGKANQAVLSLLAERLGVSASALEILTGHASADKAVRVPLDAELVRSLLTRAS